MYKRQIEGGHDFAPPVDPDRRRKIVATLDDATGWYFDLNRYDPPEMLDLIDADLARKFAIVGTPEQCADQILSLIQISEPTRPYSISYAYCYV